MNETIECPKCHAQTPALVDGECYMCVEERLYPAPPPSAAHAGLLAAWSKWRGYICDEEEPTEAQVAALMAGDAMEVALRAASPSPGAVEAAYREGYEDAADEDSMPHEDYSWHHSAARRGAAGGTDGE